MIGQHENSEFSRRLIENRVTRECCPSVAVGYGICNQAVGDRRANTGSKTDTHLQRHSATLVIDE